jgi:hypothetical protein
MNGWQSWPHHQYESTPEEFVRRITQYKTVKGSKYIINLDKEVNALIAKGFQPFGSPYIFQDIELFACQAMVRYEEMAATGSGRAGETA